MAASRNISMFFNERVAASKKDIKKKRLILKSIKEEKNVQLLLTIIPLKRGSHRAFIIYTNDKRDGV